MTATITPLLLTALLIAGCSRGTPAHLPSDSAHWRYDKQERGETVSWNFTGDILPPVEIAASRNTCDTNSINAVLGFLQLDPVSKAQPELEHLTRSRMDRAVWQWTDHSSGTVRIYRTTHTIPHTRTRYDAITRVMVSKTTH
jgi:hypothetical protein